MYKLLHINAVHITFDCRQAKENVDQAAATDTENNQSGMSKKDIQRPADSGKSEEKICSTQP